MKLFINRFTLLLGLSSQTYYFHPTAAVRLPPFDKDALEN